MSQGDFPVIVTPDGVPRVLNLVPSPPALLAMHPKSRAVRPPVSSIEPAMFRPEWLKIKDQGQYGACTGHGVARGAEAVRALAGQDGGLEGKWEELSAWDLYARACGGRDTGANILAVCQLLQAQGVCPDSMVRHGTIDPRMIGGDAALARPRFRAEIGERLMSFADIMWEVATGHAVVLSVVAGGGTVFNTTGNFFMVDPEGFPGNAPGYSDHCVVVYGEVGHSQRWGPYVGGDNSWTSQWGMKGRFRIADAHIQNQQAFEAFVIRAMYDDPQAGELPPMVKEVA